MRRDSGKFGTIQAARWQLPGFPGIIDRSAACNQGLWRIQPPDSAPTI